MKRQKASTSKYPTNSKEEEVDEEYFENDRKRIRTKAQKQNNNQFIIEIKPVNHFQDVKNAYQYVRQLCQQSKLVQEQSLLPVVWRHQLYSLFSNTAKVDLALESMIETNQIRILCHGESSRENDAIVLMDDYVNHYKQQKNLFIDLFISRIVQKHKDTEYRDIELKNSGFGPDAVKKLISLGLLTKNDLNNRQLSFAGLGILVKALNVGRNHLLKIIRKSKYSQILQSELVKRNHTTMKREIYSLGLEFHLYDLYGRSGLVIRRSANIDHDYLVQLVLS